MIALAFLLDFVLAFVFFVSRHIGARCKQRRNRNVPSTRCHRVTIQIVGAFIVNRFAILNVHIFPFIHLQKGIGKIRRALIGNTNPLRLSWNIYVENRRFVEHAVFYDKIVNFLRI